MKINFRLWLDHQEYQDFVSWLKSQGTDVNTVIRQLTQKPPDHGGGNADFWYIPDTDFGLRIIRSFNINNLEPITKHDDPLSDMNVGQPVANLGNGVQILKTQAGSPAGPKHRFHKLDPAGQQQELDKYANKVLQAGAMPQEAYDRLIQQILTLNQRGFVIDPSKPGNLLIDTDKGFNIVDVNQKKSEYTNNAGEVIIMLMGGNTHYSKISNPEVQKASQAMIRKVELASKKFGLPINHDSSSVKYSYELAGIKEWLEKHQMGQIAYHGTHLAFNKFDVNKIGQRDWGDFGYGFYLSPTQSLARLYAYDAVKKHGGKPIILSCRLMVKNTANLDEDQALWAGLTQAIKLQPKQGQSRTPEQSKAITAYFQGLGYDSAIGRHGREIVVYSSESLRVEGYYNEDGEYSSTPHN